MAGSNLRPALLAAILLIGLSTGVRADRVQRQADGDASNKDATLLDDLESSDSGLTTVTYVGFADFRTTIGSTVVVFMPQTRPGPPGPLSTRTGKSVKPTRAPVFVPERTRAPVFTPNQTTKVTTTRTLTGESSQPTKVREAPVASQVQQAPALPAVDLKQVSRPDEEQEPVVPEAAAPEAEMPEVIVPEVIVPETIAPVAESRKVAVAAESVSAFSTTQVFSTDELYPTGLVTSIGGTVVSGDIATAYTTLFYGTFIKGRYAKVAKSTSSIYSNTVLPPVLPEPTSVISEPVITSESDNSLGRAIGNDVSSQIIVASKDEAKAVLEKTKLEASTNTASAPALFSSQADGEEEKSVLKTYFTTFTYFTTEVRDGTSQVKSSLSTKTSVAAQTLPAGAVTAAKTYTVLDTETSDGQEVIVTHFKTKLELIAPTSTPAEHTSTEKIQLVTSTFFTTYTYFTTSYDGTSSLVQSRLVVSSNVVTTKLPALTQTSPTPVEAIPMSSSRTLEAAALPVALEASVNANSNVPAAVELASSLPSLEEESPKTLDPAPVKKDEQSKAEVAPTSNEKHITGLLSSDISTSVSGGATTVYSTAYLGTVVNGAYVQIVKSTTSVINAPPSTTAERQLSQRSIASSKLQPASTSPFRLVSLSSSINSQSILSVSPSSIRISSQRASSSGTSPLPQTRSSLISSSVSKPLASAPRSSNVLQSSRRLQSTSRSFLPFRRPGGGGRSRANSPRAARLLAMLAKSRGISVSALPSTASSSSSTLRSSVLPSSSVPQIRPSALSSSSVSSSPVISTTSPVKAPLTTRRRVIVKTRRSGGSGRRRRLGKGASLRGLFTNKSVERKRTPKIVTTPAPSPKLTTVSNEIIDEQPIDPTETPEFQGKEREAEKPKVASVEQRPLAFGKIRKSSSKSRTALPLGRRPKSQRPRGLASRFSAVTAAVERNVPAATTEEPITTTTTTATTTTTTTTTTETASNPSPVSTTSSAFSDTIPNIPTARSAKRRTFGNRRDRRLPFGRRSSGRGLFQRVADLQEAGSETYTAIANEPHSRSKREAAEFGTRTRSRGVSRSRRPVASTTEADLDTAASDPEPAPVRRRGGGRLSRGRNVESSALIPRARAVQPSPTEEKKQFTLTPNRSSRGRTSGSNTRRTVPGSRSRRPSSSRASPPITRPKSSASSTGSSGGRGGVSLRQRLQQARLGSTGSSSSPTSSRGSLTSSRGSLTSPRGSSRRTSSITRPRAGTSRNRSRPSGGSRIASAARRRTRPGSGGDTSDSVENNISPTPVLKEGQIIVISDNQITTSIPVYENGQTTYKEVLKASTVTKTFGPDQYTEIDIGGELRTHVGEATAVSGDGYTVISTLFLQPTVIKTGVWTPALIRGRATSTVSSYTRPAFTVQPEVRTATPTFQQQQQQAPLGGQNNILTVLLAQLLAGQTPTPALNSGFNNPILGGGGGFAPQPQAPPKPTFRTFYETTTYVTTLQNKDATTLPIYFRGRLTTTLIYGTETEVVTATEVLTKSERIQGQTAAPANSFGGGGLAGGGGFGNNFGNAGLGLTPQQLLLQQLFQQPQRQQQPLFAPQPQQQQLPLIRPTREPSLLPAASQPPQLEDLLREATGVAEPVATPASSVVTLYVTGAHPGEFYTQLSTVYNTDAVPQQPTTRAPSRLLRRGRSRRSSGQGALSLPAPPGEQPEIHSSLGYHVMSSVHDLSVSQGTATQTLDSVWSGTTQVLRQAPSGAPSALYALAKTDLTRAVTQNANEVYAGVIA